MNGILWASLGAAIGILVPLLFRLRQRRGTSVGGTLAAAATHQPARQPVKPAVTGRPPAAHRSPAGLNRKLTRRFHGISVKPGPQACQAVQELAGQRFLPEEAPAVPLAACDQGRCQCAYAHHGDRREPEDRRSGWGTFGGFSPSIPGGNRRAKSPDRRSGRH